jgi:hypothetical protein
MIYFRVILYGEAALTENEQTTLTLYALVKLGEWAFLLIEVYGDLISF